MSLGKQRSYMEPLRHRKYSRITALNKHCRRYSKESHTEEEDKCNNENIGKI
jgi:hypothetical protein